MSTPQERSLFLKLPEDTSLVDFFDMVDRLGPDQLPFAPLVDRTFSSVFYTSIWSPETIRMLKQWLGEPIIHTITTTPTRKFRSVLPYLSTGADPRVLTDVLCCEITTALFYIHDDVLDRKQTRYGRTTAYGRFGKRMCMDSWDRAFVDCTEMSRILKNTERMRFWIDSLKQLEASQSLRTGTTMTTLYEQYLSRSADRLGYVGQWWNCAARACQNDDLAEFIEIVYPHCARAGQIKNDLRNFSPLEQNEGGKQYSDLAEMKATAVTLKLMESLTTEGDGFEISPESEGNKPLSDDSIMDLVKRCQQKGILETVKDDLIAYINRIEILIDQSRLPAEVRALWLGWVYLQFRNYITTDPETTEKMSIDFVRVCKQLAGLTH